MVRDESRYIEEKIDRSTQVSNGSLGIVRKVFEHDSASDKSNHEVNVELTNGEEEFRRVPVHVDRMGHARVPQKGDFVEVSFLDSETQSPYVSGFAYSNQQRAPLARAGHWRQEFDGCDSEHLYVEAEPSDHSAGNADIIRFSKKPDGLSDPTAEIALDCSGTGVDIRLSGDDVSVTANNNVSVNAGSDMNLTAGDSVTIEENGNTIIGVGVENNGSTIVDTATSIDFDQNIIAFDDGDGTVTVNATYGVDVEDDASTIQVRTEGINFGSNLDVTDDNDGTVTVDASGGVDAEDDGSIIQQSASALNFGDNLSVSDDGDNSVTINALDGGLVEIASGTKSFDNTSGSTQTYNVTTGITDESQNILLQTYIDYPSSSPGQDKWSTPPAYHDGTEYYFNFSLPDGESATVNWWAYDLQANAITGTIGAGSGEETGFLNYDDVNPTAKSTIGLNNNNTTTHTFDGTYLYAHDFGDPNGDGTSNGFLAIYDLSDPSNPSVASQTEFNRFYKDMVVRGDYLYTTTGGNDDVCVYDISDPTNPSEVFVGLPIFNPWGIATDPNSKYLYIAHGSNPIVHVIDASTPSSLSYVTSINGDGWGAEIAYLTVHDGLLYGKPSNNTSSVTQDSIRVFDIDTDPSDPRHLGMTGSSQPLDMALATDISYANGILTAGEGSDGKYYVTEADIQTPDEASSANSGGSYSNIIKSGQVTLSSGEATIDSGVSNTETATFDIALGPSTTNAEVAADIRADSSSGNYMFDIQETDTSVGNPTINYDITRIR